MVSEKFIWEWQKWFSDFSVVRIYDLEIIVKGI